MRLPILAQVIAYATEIADLQNSPSGA